MAYDAGMDLVEVAPTERPPVCRIMDYGKWKYSQKKKQKHRGGHEVHIKEVRIRPKTDDHDRQVKMKRAVKFLEKGDKVQFTMMFRGRERFHQEIGYQTFQAIKDELAEVAKVEREARMEGRRMTMVVGPAKH
jgi:translation initiation factor IF-3